MPTCACGFEAKNLAGLKSHVRLKHPAPVGGANRIAIEQLLESLDELPDPATAQTARSIADALDKDDSNAQMWRTYREVVQDLVRKEDAGDEADDELEKVRGSAKVGHLQAV